MTAKEKKVNNICNKVTKTMIEFCYKEKIINPKIEIYIDVTNGEKYKLTFERTDLDEK